MKRKNEEKIIKKLVNKLSFKEKIIMIIFKKYTYKILKIGIEIGFNWEE